jgi:thioredoxin-dependent peroxiredoxin
VFSSKDRVIRAKGKDALVRKVPDFNLCDQSGRMHSLKSFAGKWLVLYVFSRDDTPGLTERMSDYRNHVGHLRVLGAEVVGLSADSGNLHAQSAIRADLNFSLLTDDDAITIKALGAWGITGTHGKRYEAVLRRTFLVDSESQIVKVWNKVPPNGHVIDVEKALSLEQAGKLGEEFRRRYNSRRRG